jgi:hypothetical protein
MDIEVDLPLMCHLPVTPWATAETTVAIAFLPAFKCFHEEAEYMGVA